MPDFYSDSGHGKGDSEHIWKVESACSMKQRLFEGLFQRQRDSEVRNLDNHGGYSRNSWVEIREKNIANNGDLIKIIFKEETVMANDVTKTELKNEVAETKGRKKPTLKEVLIGIGGFIAGVLATVVLVLGGSNDDAQEEYVETEFSDEE